MVQRRGDGKREANMHTTHYAHSMDCKHKYKNEEADPFGCPSEILESGGRTIFIK
jgi:hypothetical protein